MPKLKPYHIEVRGPLGVVVKVTPAEFYQLYSPTKKGYTHRRVKCTFLPGVKND